MKIVDKRNCHPIFLLTVVFSIFLFSNCDRRELTYSDEAEITILVDWSKAGLNKKEEQYGATAIFYPVNGKPPITVLMGDRNHKTVRLKEGNYNVVLFNRSFDDFNSIAFRGMDAHHTLEAYAKSTQTEKTNNEKIVTESPDELAADCIENFKITANMLGNYASGTVRSAKNQNSCQLCFIPKKLTKEITATIHIKGINHIRSATCTLDGISESIFLVSAKSSERTITQQFELENPLYLPGSQTEGILSATFSVFGFDESIPHNIYFKALLIDGKTEFEEDLKNIKMDVWEDGEGIVRIIIEMVCEEPVPPVIPEGSSGMDAEVDGWGQEDNKDIDI